jgi:hypothetical protein
MHYLTQLCAWCHIDVIHCVGILYMQLVYLPTGQTDVFQKDHHKNTKQPKNIKQNQNNPLKMPFSLSSYTSYSVSTSGSLSQNGETQNWGHRSANQVFRDEDNSKHERSLSQNLGEDPVYEEKHYDSQGRQLLDDGSGQQQQQQHRQGHIEDVTDRQ